MLNGKWYCEIIVVFAGQNLNLCGKNSNAGSITTGIASN
jgi:hypothetical protein